MSCESCHSENQSESNREVAIHFPGLKGLDKPIAWVFPKLLVCLNCGFKEFVVLEIELRRLVGAMRHNAAYPSPTAVRWQLAAYRSCVIPYQRQRTAVHKPSL
jgi:hypothetical protein